MEHIESNNTSVVTEAEFEVLMSLQSRGCAVVVFTPEELSGVGPKWVEDRMVEVGWGTIFQLQDVEEQ